MTLSLRARLLLGLVALVVAGMTGSAIATYGFLQKSLTDQLDATLSAAVNPAADSLAGGFREGPGGAGGGGLEALPNGTYVEMRDQAGASVVVAARPLSYFGGVAGRPELPESVSPSGVDTPVFSTISGEDGVAHYRMVAERVDRIFGSPVVIVAAPLTGVESTLQRLLLLEAAITALIVLAMVVVAWLVVNAGLRPLQRMGQTAQAIAAGDLSRRVEPAGERTEIGRLGLALNQMLTQIEDAFSERTRSEQRLRRFIADASHELRTPLTSIRGYAELLRRGADRKPEDAALARRRIEEESVRMTGLVEDMLLLARLDQGRPLEREHVDLAHIALDACHDARVVAPGRAVELEAPAPVLVSGDEQRLRQVIGNLVRNAIVHTPASTPVGVSVASRDGHALLSVVDHGPGLAPDVAARVFEPFFRADAGRSRDRGGSGLGLSIVAAVVAAHGGQVGVSETLGGGATFTVVLPLEGGGQGGAADGSDGTD